MLERLEKLQKVVKELNEAAVTDEDETGKNKQTFKQFLKKMPDEMLEEFVDGILLTLGEMEVNGDIPEMETADDARDAVVAAVKALYTKRGIIGKMARKYKQFGTKRLLRKAKIDIGRAIS